MDAPTLSAAVAPIRDHLDRTPTVAPAAPYGDRLAFAVSVQGWHTVARPMREVIAAVEAAGGTVLGTDVLDVGDEDCAKSSGRVLVAA